MEKNSNLGLNLFLYGLTLVFIFCKLTNHIDWSWFWVLSPILFQFIIAGIILFFALILTIASNIKIKLKQKKNKKVDYVDFDETMFGEN